MSSRSILGGRWHFLVFLAALSPIMGGVAHAQVTSIDGTWKLVMRELPDGTKVYPPAIAGLYTLSKGQRNLNVLWHNAQGKVASFSSVSLFKLTHGEYTETLIYNLLSDTASDQGPVYNLSGETRTAPVKRDGGRIDYTLPFGEPNVVFDGDKLTATMEGAFVDYWERVK